MADPIKTCKCGAHKVLTVTGVRYEENAGAICRHGLNSCDWFNRAALSSSPPPGTPPDLAALRALEAKATPGPWHVGNRDFILDVENDEIMEVLYSDADAAFIAASRTALPALLDEVKRLTKERDAARAEGRREVVELVERYCESITALPADGFTCTEVAKRRSAALHPDRALAAQSKEGTDG